MDLETKFNLILKELKNICTQIDKRFEQVDKHFEEIDKRFKRIEHRLEKLESKFDTLSNEVGSINRLFFKSDINTLENFETLFEANTTNDDKELIFENQLCRLHDSLDDTITRVSILEKNMAVNS